MIKEYYYPFDLNVKDIWERISDFWEDFADKDVVEEFWGGYKLLFDDHLGKLSYALNMARSLEYVDMTPELEWYLFQFEASLDRIEINPYIYDIPTLQDTRENPSTILVKGVDYNIVEEYGKKYIVLIVVPKDEDISYWAPTIEYDMRKVIYNFFGCLFPLIEYNVYPPEAYRMILQSIFWYCFRGPSLENVKKVVASLCEITQTRYNGKVQSVTAGTINDTIMIRDEMNRDFTYTVPTGKSAVAENDVVTRFESLRIGVIVEDFKTSPNWWVGKQNITEVEARNIVYVSIAQDLATKIAWYGVQKIVQFLLPKRCRLYLEIFLPVDALITWDANQTNIAKNYPI